jgi:hypothetical protein
VLAGLGLTNSRRPWTTPGIGPHSIAGLPSPIGLQFQSDDGTATRDFVPSNPQPLQQTPTQSRRIEPAIIGSLQKAATPFASDRIPGELNAIPTGSWSLAGLMFFSGQSCPNCNAAIHGAVAAEYVSDTHVRNIWWCDSCNQLSRTSIFLDFDARKSVNIAASGRHPGQIERPPPGREDGRSARRARPPHSAAYLRRWFRMASAGQAPSLSLPRRTP